jgi:hypothetical protein
MEERIRKTALTLIHKKFSILHVYYIDYAVKDKYSHQDKTPSSINLKKEPYQKQIFDNLQEKIHDLQIVLLHTFPYIDNEDLITKLDDICDECKKSPSLEFNNTMISTIGCEFVIQRMQEQFKILNQLLESHNS